MNSPEDSRFSALLSLGKKNIPERIRKLKDRYIMPAFFRKMRKLKLGSVSGNNSVEIHTDGDSFFRAISEAIISARKSINMETYTFASDETGWEIAGLLSEKAREGLEVNLIFDSLGSIGSSRTIFSSMARAGVEIVEYNPVRPWKNIFMQGHRDHRKILVVDGSIAFIGGNNIGNDYSGGKYRGRNWRDTHLKIQGPAVRDIQYIFLENWYRNAGAMMNINNHIDDGHIRGGITMMILGSMARRRSHKPIIQSYLTAIGRARKSIYITNAYFIPSGKLLRAVTHAARRGVDVRIMMPKNSDVKIAQYASRYLYRRYMKCGMRLYEYRPTMLHAKTAVIDGVWSTVGSSNLDRFTLVRNLEINAVITDRGFGEEMKRIFMSDMKSCDEMMLSGWEKRSPMNLLLEWLCYHLFSIL
jgi:cardiolipin synthase